MSTYRVYKVNGHNRIDGPPAMIEADTDEEAMLKAQPFAANGSSAEVWRGTHLIGRYYDAEEAHPRTALPNVLVGL